MSLTKRRDKGTPLTHDEMDNNFIGLANGSNLTASEKKRQCTAWVIFDGKATPPVIIDSYNIYNVIRKGLGVFELVFETPMDNSDYCLSGGADYHALGHVAMSLSHHPTISPTRDRATIAMGINGSLTQAGVLINSKKTNVQFFGGKA